VSATRTTERPEDPRLRVVLASANPHKAAELAAIVDSLLGDRVQLVPRPAEVPPVAETGGTFVANARLKAHALRAATGLPALADDSGIEVAVLGGAPGVDSAYYAGETASDDENVAKLLGALAAAGATEARDRRARFRAVVVLAWPDGTETVAEGEVAGVVLPEPRGRDGFGYDPVFAPDGGGGRSFAELSAADKHRLSHRGRALAALAEELADDPRLPARPPAPGGVRIVMVCHGNICRSPMAAAVASALFEAAGMGGRATVSSRGTSGYHQGERADPGAEAALRRRGLTAAGHRARQLTAAEVAGADLVLCADRANLAAVRRLAPDAGDKVRLLREFDPAAGPGDDEVPDPYGGDDCDFEAALERIEAACQGLVASLVARSA
jgi:XTP/dITP diphosphohydrolase